MAEANGKKRIAWGRETMASVVVFLVALPLCMGIAIASGVSPALGLVTGIVGGIVVGALAGSPLQVSGPAASLTVLVYQLVKTYGIGALGVAVLVAGAIQLIAGALKLGSWFRAVSPAVITGLLAGIGVIILASQLHVMLDSKPLSSPLQNLITFPSVAWGVMTSGPSSRHFIAALIGILTIGGIVGWNRWRPEKLKGVPGPLVGVLLGTIAANVANWGVDFVKVPSNLAGALNIPALATFKLLGDASFMGSALAIGLMASTATLLCATAVDRLHDGVRTDYDRELMAHGVGNMLCGVVGALPMTGVIVRSSANVEAGARTRWSAVMHGVWLLGLVALLPAVLRLIPVASLGAILVYTGFRLAHPSLVKTVAKTGRGELVVFLATVICIVAFDLLIGIGVGFGLAIAKVLYGLVHLDIQTIESEGGERVDVALHGAATFIKLPRLAKILAEIDKGHEVHLHVGGLAYIDHACIESLRDFQVDYEKDEVGTVLIEWDDLEVRKNRFVTQPTRLATARLRVESVLRPGLEPEPKAEPATAS